MSEYKNGGNNNMLWEQGQVRILVPRHRKPRSYRNVTPFFCLHKIMVEIVVEVGLLQLRLQPKKVGSIRFFCFDISRN